jgi:hypothetical protein
MGKMYPRLLMLKMALRAVLAPRARCPRLLPPPPPPQSHRQAAERAHWGRATRTTGACGTSAAQRPHLITARGLVCCEIEIARSGFRGAIPAAYFVCFIYVRSTRAPTDGPSPT